jgi:hypothetical protein
LNNADAERRLWLRERGEGNPAAAVCSKRQVRFLPAGFPAREFPART